MPFFRETASQRMKRTLLCVALVTTIPMKFVAFPIVSASWFRRVALLPCCFFPALSSLLLLFLQLAFEYFKKVALGDVGGDRSRRGAGEIIA